MNPDQCRGTLNQVGEKGGCLIKFTTSRLFIGFHGFSLLFRTFQGFVGLFRVNQNVLFFSKAFSGLFSAVSCLQYITSVLSRAVRVF